MHSLSSVVALTLTSVGLLMPLVARAADGGAALDRADAGVSHPGGALDLSALLTSAEENHPSLAKQPLLEKSLELQHSRLNRGYLPRLSLGGRATWQSAVTEVDVPVPGISINPPPKDQYQATLDLKQSIWDGGVISNQKKLVASRIKVEQEKVGLEWYQVRRRILELYFAGLVQQELEQQGRVLAGYIGTLIEKTELLVEQGLAIERDVLLLQARQLEAQQAGLDARENQSAIRKSLEQLTGKPLPASSSFTTPARTCSEKERKTLDKSAVKRPELRVLSAQEALLDEEERVTRAGDRPKLDAFATAGYGRPGLNMLEDEFDFYFIGGVQLTVPLTHLYAGTHQNGDRKVAVERSLLARQRDAVMLQVKVEHETQSTALERLDQILAMDEKLLDLRENARKQTEKQVELGTAATSDLVSDLSQEDQAKSLRALHHAERSLACHELAFLRGDL